MPSSDDTFRSDAAGPEATAAQGVPPREDTLGAQAQVSMDLLKTLNHFFPNFSSWLASMPDPRDPRYITYPIAYILMSGLLLFLTKLGARRQMRFHFRVATFIHNLNLLCGTTCETMLHPDTLAYLLKRLPPEALEELRRAMVNELLRKKVLEKARLLGKYYLVVIDGTGHLTFTERHCTHCLTHSREGKVLYYYHPVLEAKLVTPWGLAISMGTEFIQNPGVPVEKQDCERKAFMRLAERLKRDFPQLWMCLLMDGLYACEPVFDRCADYGWRFIVTFKEGSAPAVFEDFTQLQAAGGESHKHNREETLQEFGWVNEVGWGQRKVNVLECREQNPKDGPKRFVWVTDITIDRANVEELGNRGGRLRWKIENEGFNAQKNGGYEMEHAYCEQEQAAKNFYLLLQIGHMIAQLLEKGLLRKAIKRIGAIRNVARFLLEELRRILLDTQCIRELLAQRIQIRFADSS